MKSANYLLILIIAAIAGCKKPYDPPAITSKTSYLVVEGVINAGSDSTIFRLSKTVNLSSATTKNPQLHAIVTVEGDQNTSYPLKETTAGTYVSPGLNLDFTHQYRLRIITTDNQQYLSDFVPVKVTPPIDSIGFNIVDNNVQIYANTHDAANRTRYYRWDYTETWQFHAKYFTSYVTNGKAIVPRTPNQYVYGCFASDASSSINIASTAKLSQDVVYQAPITAIASTSEKIETRYSILLRQYALTPDAYNFWQNLKTNTEQLGSIFDAQPSTSIGNIHNINNPADIIVGYISAGTVQKKRVFISNTQLPFSWNPVYPYTCSLDTNLYNTGPPYNTNQVALYLIPTGSSNIPAYAIIVGGGIVGYLSSSPECVDCTLRGTTTVPAFW